MFPCCNLPLSPCMSHKMYATSIRQKYIFLIQNYLSLYAILFSLTKYVQFFFHLTDDWYELKFQGKKHLSISIHGLCYCTVQVYVINNFCNGVCSFWVEANMQVFYYHFLYVLPLEIQLSGEGSEYINRSNPNTLLCLSQARIPKVICHGLFLFNEFS